MTVAQIVAQIMFAPCKPGIIKKWLTIDQNSECSPQIAIFNNLLRADQNDNYSNKWQFIAGSGQFYL